MKPIQIDAEGLTPEEIQKALQQAKEKKRPNLKDMQVELCEIDKEIHNLTMQLYPERISKACKYPDCENNICYFGDKQELCPSYYLNSRKGIEIV